MVVVEEEDASETVRIGGDAGAKWLAEAHKQKANELQMKEEVLYRAMGKSIADGSNEMSQLWSGYNSWEQGTGPGTARGAFEAARKYTGSIVVTFDQNTNLPDPAQLATARRRAACLKIAEGISFHEQRHTDCLLYTSPSPRDGLLSRMPSSA